MAKSSSGSGSLGKAGASLGRSMGNFGGLRALPSPTRALDLGEFIDAHTKFQEYEVKRPKVNYDKAPMEVGYRMPSYGRDAIDSYSRINLSGYKISKDSYVGRDFYMANVSYKQIAKYSLN